MRNTCSVCYKCKDRAPACHAECEKYAEEKKRCTAEKEVVSNKRIKEGQATAYFKESCVRKRRSHRYAK